MDSLRRDFMKLAGAGLAGTAIAASRTAPAQAPSLSPASACVDVQKFGATGDGKTIDSPAINKAIDSAAAAGGGTVCFPAGSYLCYSIHLKSNIALKLEQGAVIIAADPKPEGQPGGYERTLGLLQFPANLKS